MVFGSKDDTSYDGTSRIELKYSADTDTWCYAGIVAQSNNTLTGVTSFVPVTVTADSRCKSRTGGIVGSLYNGKMSGCRNYGAVSNVATAGVASYVAGIAGIVDGSGDAAGAITLDGCHNHGPVMTSLGLGNAVAGITASVMKTAVNTTISNCTNAGEIRFDNAGTSAAHRIGGIVAYIVDSCPTLVIDNCTNKGTVVSNMNGNCFIGGIAGVNYAAAIRDCTNEAEVKFVQANAAGAGYLCIGGIAGQTYSGAKVTGCANRAAVSSDKLQVTRIGGIVGTHNASTIDDCSNSGDITLAYTATANNWEAAGGIVGFYDGTDGTAVTNGCTNSGKVWATVNSSNANIGAGGIAGIIKSGNATNNTNDGAVWMHNAQAGKSSYAGGIVGYDYNTKDKSAVTGNVNNGAVQATVEGTSALLAAGGIIGRNDVGAVSGCRNFGAVACALHAGALVGWNKKSVEDSAAGGSVNGTALTGTNYAELAVGFQDGGSSSGITFGEK